MEQQVVVTILIVKVKFLKFQNNNTIIMKRPLTNL